MSAHIGMADAAGNLTASIARLAQTTASYTRARLDEADDLLQTETRRQLTVLLSACGLILWLSSALLFAGVAVIAACWDTNRVLASAAVAVGYLFIAAAAGWLLLLKCRQRPSLLDWGMRLLALFSRTH